jgi:A/G-specific adenine glycosylase
MTNTTGHGLAGSTGSRRLARLRASLGAWGPAEGRMYPWRESPDPYLRLVAEVLLQRTRADAVASVWPGFVRSFPTPERLARVAEDRIALTIRPLGLVRKRARYLKRLAEALTESGAVPTDLGTLSALPGVGPYSAAAFLTSWRGVRTAPVDANIRRVLGRVALGVETADEQEAKTLVKRLLSRGDATTILYALLDLGNAPCRPRRPECGRCPARSFCLFGRRELTRSRERATPSATTARVVTA